MHRRMLMNVNIINPFLEAVKNVLSQFGISDIKVQGIKKEKKYDETEIISIIGLVGDVRGNVSYSMSEDTAKKVVSTMMMGMPVESIDEMAMSAVGELTNMFTGNASTILAQNGFKIDITPPSTVIGQNIYVNIGKVKTILVNMETSAGKIEVNVGLEDG
jgi:chemotaxis protein CheX